MFLVKIALWILAAVVTLRLDRETRKRRHWLSVPVFLLTWPYFAISLLLFNNKIKK